MADYTKEITKRRTFAIISHPDAGKTTLTEKFLLYGGAINLAGSVKGKATARHAVSTGWKLKKKEVFPLHLPYFSLIMTVIALTYWILLDIRISRRTHIVLNGMQILQLWSLMLQKEWKAQTQKTV